MVCFSALPEAFFFRAAFDKRRGPGGDIRPNWELQPSGFNGKKTLLLSIESWLVNRDPYNGLL